MLPAVTIGVLIFVLLPALITGARSGGVLTLFSLLLPIAGGVVFVLSSGSGIGLLPIGVGGMLWISGLMCGIAAFHDAAAERRHRERVPKKSSAPPPEPRETDLLDNVNLRR